MPSSPSESQQPQSDEQLLQLYCQGQSWAFDELVDRYQQELFHFLIRFSGSRAAAEDLFQEAFLQVHLSASTFDSSKRFKPWLFTIAANKARDYLRRHLRRQAMPLSAPLPGQAGEDGQTFVDLLQSDLELPVEVLNREETRQQVQNMMLRLNDAQREILALAYFHQFPYRDIAEVLGIPLGTVKSRLHSAVAAFAHQWKLRHSQEI
jgi:RNA polymerase sigma-70 factor (ECF subfamily)